MNDYNSQKLCSFTAGQIHSLHQRCKPNEKVVLINDIPTIVPKTKLDLFLDKIGKKFQGGKKHAGS